MRIIDPAQNRAGLQNMNLVNSKKLTTITLDIKIAKFLCVIAGFGIGCALIVVGIIIVMLFYMKHI